MDTDDRTNETKRPASGGTTDFIDKALHEKLDLMLKLLKQESPHGATSPEERPSPTRSLKVRIEPSIAEASRYPFTFHLSGIVRGIIRVSAVRASILTVLLTKLQTHSIRKEDQNTFEEICRVYQRLVPEANDAQAKQRIKSGMSRSDDLLGTLPPPPGGKGYSLSFARDGSDGELQLLLDDNVADDLDTLVVDVSAESPVIQDELHRLAAVPLIDRLRRRRVMYVEGGPHGFDELFVELFDHAHDVHEESLYFKPSIITYPESLLRVLNASEQDLRRKRAMYDAFGKKRCNFKEILNRESIWDMIRTDELGHFQLYGPSATADHVTEHLMAMIEDVQKYTCHQLTLTDAPLPFFVSTFQITRPDGPDHYTIFFRHKIREHDAIVNAFAIADPVIHRAVSDHVIGWVLKQPSTTSDRLEVIKFLGEVLERFRNHGPLGPHARHFPVE